MKGERKKKENDGRERTKERESLIFRGYSSRSDMKQKPKQITWESKIDKIFNDSRNETVKINR